MRQQRKGQQFTGNIRQLRNEDKSQNDFFVINADESSQLMDSSDHEYSDDLENLRHINQQYRTHLAKLGHVFMLTLFIFLLATYIKSYLINDPSTFASYSYLLSFGIPSSLIILVLSDIIYERFVAKLQQSHTAIYKRFLACLVLVTLAAVTALILISIYMSDPQDLSIIGGLALIPYYLCWLMVTSFYIYISPGLMDPSNNIPKYQVAMAAIYILFVFAYPIIYIVVGATEGGAI